MSQDSLAAPQLPTASNSPSSPLESSKGFSSLGSTENQICILFWIIPELYSIFYAPFVLSLQEKRKGGVLVSERCYNKLPQTGWLKTTIYSLTILVLGSHPCLFRFLVAVQVPWFVAASLNTPPPFSYGLLPVFMPTSQISLCLSLVRIPAIGFRAYPESMMIPSQDSSLHMQRAFFPNKATFIGSGWRLGHTFWRATIQLITHGKELM